MKKNKHSKYKKLTIAIALLMLSTALTIPITQGLTITNHQTNTIQKTQQTTNTPTAQPSTLGAFNFSISLHRIKQEDEIDPWPHGEADWRLGMYVNGEKKSKTYDGDDINIGQDVITWENHIGKNDTTVDIKMELLDRDPDYLDEHDIADISGHIGGGKDDSTDFDNRRGAVFKHTYNLETEEWVPVDENNDFLKVEEQDEATWYLTSGSFDGSTKKDENDASIWFNVHLENRQPYPPEKPEGPKEGEVNQPVTFRTRCQDPDGDRIQFGWDWNGDKRVDEKTRFYDSWKDASISHTWTEAKIYTVRVCAIDEKGMISDWSESITIKIDSPQGINDIEKERYWYGVKITVWMDHKHTQDLVNTLQQTTGVITAVAALITAIAAAAGIPLDISTAIAIATALSNILPRVIAWRDVHNKGIIITYRSWLPAPIPQIWISPQK